MSMLRRLSHEVRQALLNSSKQSFQPMTVTYFNRSSLLDCNTYKANTVNFNAYQNFVKHNFHTSSYNRDVETGLKCIGAGLSMIGAVGPDLLLVEGGMRNVTVVNCRNAGHTRLSTKDAGDTEMCKSVPGKVPSFFFFQSIGIGTVYGNLLTGVARNPSTKDQLFTLAIMGMVFCETICLICFICSMIIINS